MNGRRVHCTYSYSRLSEYGGLACPLLPSVEESPEQRESCRAHGTAAALGFRRWAQLISSTTYVTTKIQKLRVGVSSSRQWYHVINAVIHCCSKQDSRIKIRGVGLKPPPFGYTLVNCHTRDQAPPRLPDGYKYVVVPAMGVCINGCPKNVDFTPRVDGLDEELSYRTFLQGSGELRYRNLSQLAGSFVQARLICQVPPRHNPSDRTQTQEATHQLIELNKTTPRILLFSLGLTAADRSLFPSRTICKTAVKCQSCR